ncbi:MAG: hypothetical protein ACXQS5_06935 [Candidatus Methanospirareceae archaeon]
MMDAVMLLMGFTGLFVDRVLLKYLGNKLIRNFQTRLNSIFGSTIRAISRKKGRMLLFGID